MHKLILDNLLLINHSNMFRPLNRSYHQGVRNPWELQSLCIDLLECCYVYLFTSRYDDCGMLRRKKKPYAKAHSSVALLLVGLCMTNIFVILCNIM